MRTFTRRTQARLAFVFSLLFLAVAGAAVTAFWTSDSLYEYATVDQSLRGQADLVRAIVAQSTSDSTIPVLPPGNPRGVGMDSYVVNSSGRILSHDQADFETGPVIAWAMQSGFPAHALIANVRINGSEIRILTRVITIPDGSKGGLVVARPIQELQNRLNRIAILLVSGVLVVQLIVSLLAWRLAGLALVPIREISVAARDIGERDLHQRLAFDIPPDDELGELVTTFNAMLGRLESYLETQQRFTADAAHELRAPLAIMRSQVEVTMRQPRTAAEYRKSHRALLVEIQRLSRTADQLLLLARADAGELRVAGGPCDVPDLVEETVGRWRTVADAKPVELVAVAPSSGVIRADRDLLGRLLDNLIDNALRHTPAGGRVTLAAKSARNGWTLTVTDTGPGIPAGARKHVFERFYRVDSARERGPHGAGLGLSLCWAIVQLHRGSIEIADPGEPGGTQVVVRLPSSGA
ncbi:MAG TPA: ATP-binding protein [Candidatus Dormibacteraeota bacterium]|nr:ATP-binding protein [Candidatus Dormibacteraeota bacterium]